MMLTVLNFAFKILILNMKNAAIFDEHQKRLFTSGTDGQ